MEEDDKPFACSFAGCNMRFTNEDHLTVHKKKHDMVLNLGNGQKNVFVADQTPTPTRFIRNCEEVGLFQDLQNVNPFEETFRKAVEAAKTGVGSLHEVDTLSVHTGADDTLHTPHVFPHIIEDSTSNSSSAYKTVPTALISSTSVITGNGRNKSSDDCTSPAQRQDLDQLLHPTSTTEEGNFITPDILEERRVVDTDDMVVELSSTTKVVRQEADTSQHKVIVQQDACRQIITSNAESKNGISVGILNRETSTVTASQTLSSAGGNTVQLLLRMPDGKLLQLSALPVEQVAPTGGNVLVQLSQAESQSVPSQNSSVVFSQRPAAVATRVPVITPEADKNVATPTKTTTPTKQSSGLSLAKLIEASKTAPENQTTSSSRAAPARRSSSSSVGDDAGEKRQKFLERNRAAAMRCREKRKTWIQELERRAEEMLTTNHQLQSEVASLRAEVAQLKTLLLAHKDCPVTQAMAQGSSVPAQSAVQPQIINVTLPIQPNTNGLLPSTQTNTSNPVVQQHASTVPHNQLILVNGSSNLKRVSSEPIITPKKKLVNNQGSPIIRQALLLPSTQAESIRVINSSAVKTTTTNKIPQTSASVTVTSMPTVPSGVLVTNPIITTPVTVPANQLAISAVIQNSGNYQQTFIVPKICLPTSVTPVVTDVERIIQGNSELQKKTSDDEIGSHVIKINPNVLRKSTDSVLSSDLSTSMPASDADSDIEIITEVRSENESAALGVPWEANYHQMMVNGTIVECQ
ncbi:cyclic AMP-dependent transcription factor ATF-2 isoform X2 [Periplaneta americana]|uniref:cyclic AMP-dependent transcription factor ATF-2 isoform X2 n=1 Tax=Periplaneta americana TaxID=6978 RepID=UPI0037E75E94